MEESNLLGVEVAKVQAELIVFCDEYLVAFLSRSVLESEPGLSSWQQAVGKLSEAIPIGGDSANLAPLRPEELKDFMFEEATPGFSRSAGGIRWKIGLFNNLDWIHVYCWPPGLELKDAMEETEEFLAALPKFNTWLLGLPVDDCVLLNGLCMFVPFIADIEPAFGKLALNLDTWRTIVSANTSVSEDQRRKWLGFIDHAYFRHVVNNALLHLFGSLANNHFMTIRDYLEHPCLYGGYTRLMPHYLFALLFQKVSILRKLAQDKGG